MTNWIEVTKIFRARKTKGLPVNIRLDLTKRRLALLDRANSCIMQNSDKGRVVFADIKCRLGTMNTDGTVHYFSAFNECKTL